MPDTKRWREGEIKNVPRQIERERSGDIEDWVCPFQGHIWLLESILKTDCTLAQSTRKYHETQAHEEQAISENRGERRKKNTHDTKLLDQEKQNTHQDLLVRQCHDQHIEEEISKEIKPQIEKAVRYTIDVSPAIVSLSELPPSPKRFSNGNGMILVGRGHGASGWMDCGRNGLE